MLKKFQGKNKLFRLVSLFLLVLVFSISLLAGLQGANTKVSAAGNSSDLNFQARLLNSDGAIVPDGSYNLQFRLYNVASGDTGSNPSTGATTGNCGSDVNCLWQETYTGTPGPTGRMTVQDGYVSVYLGSVTSFPSTIDWEQPLWLSINVGGSSSSVNWDGEMSPRIQLTALPYAFIASQLATTTSGGNREVLNWAPGGIADTAADTISLPDGSGTVCVSGLIITGCAGGSGAYVSLQVGSPGSPDNGNFNINGVGIAGSLYSNTFDTSTGGGTLSVGASNASAISLGQNTTVASGKSFTANGLSLFEDTSNTPEAFQVTNASGTDLLNVDTTNSVNLVSNPGFEVNATNWSAVSGSSISQYTASKTNIYEGQGSLQISTSGTGQGAKTSSFTSALTTGTTYTLSFYARASGSNFSTLQAGRADNGTPTNCSLTPSNVLTTGFQRYSCTFTTGGTLSSPYIYITQSDGASRTFYVDAVQLQTGSQLTPYTVGQLQLTGVINSPVTFQNASDSTTAFQIENAAGTFNLLTADTLDSRIGIGTSTPAYTLDVNGIINAATAVYTPTLDTTPGGSLAIGPSNATGGINLDQNTTVASGKTLTVDNTASILGANALTLGTAGPSGINGAIKFQESGSANAVTLLEPNSTTGNFNLYIPTITSNDTICTNGVICAAYAPVSPDNGFIYGQNSSPGSAQATSSGGNFNIAGVGIAGTSFQAPLLDTPVGTPTLAIGTTNATGINLNQNTTVASGKSLTANTIQSATSTAIAITGNAQSTISTSAGNLIVQGGSGTVSLGTSTIFAAAAGLTVESGLAGGNTALTLQSGGTGTASLDTGSSGGTASVGASTAAIVNIGNVSETGATTIYGGTNNTTGAIVLSPAAAGGIMIGGANETGTITLGQSGSTNTINIGSAAGTSATQTINIGYNSTPTSTATNNITIGSTVAGTTLLQTLGIQDTLSSTTGNEIVKTTTNNIVGYRIQNATGATILNADTVNDRISIDSGFTAVSTPATPTIGSFSNTGGGLAAATYWYRVTAVDAAGGETQASNGVSQAISGSAGQITLNWTAVTGATGYRIYRGTGVSQPAETLYDYVVAQSSPAYTDLGTGPAPGGALPTASTGPAYYTTSQNQISNNLELSVGDNGTPTGQIYIGGTVPATPLSRVATAGSLGSFSNIAVQGKYAYVIEAGPTNGLQVFDVSNPTNPVSVGTQNLLAGETGENIYVSGRYVYVVEASASADDLQIFDISNPISPTSVGSKVILGTGTANSDGLYVQGNYVYVTNANNSTMQVIDVTNPSNPNILQSSGQSTGTTPVAVAAEGSWIYVLNQGTANIESFYAGGTYSLSNPNVGSSRATGSTPTALYVQGRYAYVVNSGANSLQIFDISNPSLIPVAVGTLTGLSTPTGIFIQGRYAYITNKGSSTLQVVDVSNPYLPASVGTIPVGTNPLAVNIQGRYAYVVNSSTPTLQIIDLGGEYAQQLEAGGAEFGTLAVDGNTSIDGSSSILGGLQVGQSLEVSGNVGVTTNSGIGLLQVDTVGDNVYLGTTGTTALASTVNIANSTSGMVAQIVSIGSQGSSTSTTTINGGTGTGAIGIQAGTGGTISIGTSNNNLVQIGGSNTVAGTIQIGSATETGTITVGQFSSTTGTSIINIGSAAGNGGTQTIKIGNSTTTGSTTNLTIGSTIGTSSLILNGTGVNDTLGTSDIVKTTTNSATGFEIANTGGTAVVTGDTNGNNLILGTAGSIGTNLVFEYGTAAHTGSITIQANDPSTTAYQLYLPAVNGQICTTGNWTACAGAQNPRTKYITLTPEYTNAVLDGTLDSPNDIGTMIAGFDSTSTPSTSRQGYYQWTTGQTTGESYDIVITWVIPQDFQCFLIAATAGCVGGGIGSGAPLIIDTKYGDSTNTDQYVHATLTNISNSYTAETNCGGSSGITLTPSSSSWTATNTCGGGTFAGTYSAGQILELRLQMYVSSNSYNVKVGNIVFGYESAY